MKQYDSPQWPIIPKRKRGRRSNTVLAPLRNQLSFDQLDHLRSIATTYTPDLHDAAAVEVLLVLLEVCYILELSPSRLNYIFGKRHLHTLLTWGDILPAMRRPAHVRRAWVWVSNRPRPRLYAINEEGCIQIDPPRSPQEE